MTPKEVVEVNESHASPVLPAAAPAATEAVNRASKWTAGHIAALGAGVLLVLLALALLTAGAIGLWADTTQRSAGYVMTGSHDFTAGGSALATEPTELGSSGVGWLYAPGLLGKVRIKVTPADPASTLFVGIGPSKAVDRYLAGVGHTLVSDYLGGKAREIGGGRPAGIPGKQRFWVASTTGTGDRDLLWKPTDGSWSVVVMNADGQPGVDVKADLGGEFPDLLWITVGLLVAGAVFAVGSAFLIRGAMTGRRVKREEE